ncbi:energy-coupling factor ABC transporter substrate-binding protein [Aerococcus urinae]|uniref:Cobalt transport protein CbiN n=1 Tax=Aerococcus urinae TaxID=1376 RepID=A0A0X8FG08_9LACT|nr:energy-coupling factor ABC transporter substrate-binding protein [Aerococcus urinae]AMB96582.1 cobalamin biosynthesis protein CbiN [Aerococcus urinae]MCY3032979.1 energy-coupling factor ABC transporter substrate-binding protein [Aerococcus urinae]MCY3038123.1 energy-coupling factor ABC transporter substrate-binding protein [Aerococcus urinae]MCY3045025.1 energy-coupling factor ABC transporter substrate-binding protein [Aerococcus urinae]MCY3046185.1 energy-coupling factor ABC transporter su
MKKKNLLLILLALLIMFIPLFTIDGEYEGSDGGAEELIGELDESYTPWFEPIFEPASGEIESLLFTLQGSIGTGIICGIVGYYLGKNKGLDQAKK